MAKRILTLGAKAAMIGDVKASVTIEVHMTRRYIWVMKLRYIWAIIRAKMERTSGAEEGECE